MIHVLEVDAVSRCAQTLGDHVYKQRVRFVALHYEEHGIEREDPGVFLPSQ